MKCYILCILLIAIVNAQDLSGDQLELLKKIQEHFENTVNGLPQWAQENAKQLIEKHFGRRDIVDGQSDLVHLATRIAVTLTKPIVEEIKTIGKGKVDFEDFAKVNEVVQKLRDVLTHILTKSNLAKDLRKRQSNEANIKHIFDTALHVGNILNQLKQQGITNIANVANIFKGDFVGKIDNIVSVVGKRDVNVVTKVGGKVISSKTGDVDETLNIGDIELLKALGIISRKRSLEPTNYAININVKNDIGGKMAGQIRNVIQQSCLKDLWANVTINITNVVAGNFLGQIRNIINVQCGYF